MALIYNASFDSTTRVLSLLDKAGNVISSCNVPDTQPLTLKATTDNSSVKLHKQDSSSVLANTYEVDIGNGWEAYTFDTVINLNAGDRCRWRCSSHTTEQTGLIGYVGFVMTGSIEASGNINSMLSSEYRNITSLEGHAYAFYGLFKGCTSLVDVTKLKLPATTLATHCYDNLFYGCSAITTPPELPATTIVASCYSKAFSGCSSLTQTPDLAASTLPNVCYENMFSSCGSLTKIYLGATSAGTRSIVNWQPAASGDIYCDPNFTLSGISNITNWNRWVYKATDTGATTTMYRKGVAETVMIGTSSYGTCYSIQDWAGFRTLDQMHSAGYTFGVQTQITMYGINGDPTTSYKCEANAADGFTETMYAAGQGGYKSYTAQKTAGYYLPQDIPLTIYNNSTVSSTVKLVKTGTVNNTYEYNLEGTGWTSYTLGNGITLQARGIVQFRCTDHSQTTQTSSNYVKFTITGSYIKAYGNINSMIDGTNFATMTSLAGYDWAFCNFFKSCTSLYEVKDLKLPATTLSESCYRSFFDSCTGFSEPPELPATTLATYCYRSFFYNSGVTHSPALPATTMATGAYYRMFMNCASLLDCPELPATTLADEAYYQMFYNCDAITKAPLLPATTLTATCYKWIYANSALLAEVRIAATDATATDCLMEWLSNCAASGTVYADPALTLPTDSISGIPTGWTRLPLSDYPTT